MAIPGNASLLVAQGVSLSRGDRTVLDGVDLALQHGETTVVLGPNGAGKSSLLAVLAGLLTPTRGSVTAHGRVAAALQTPALADRSVQANVELALRWWGVPRAERARRTREALALTGAGALARRPARELSGGEARRVHLARSLAVQPDVLLLDEPFAGLDAATRADLLADSVAALRSPTRATLIVVHDRAEAWALADRVLVLMAGRIAADGGTSQVLETPPSEDVAAFLGFSGRIEGGAVVRRFRPADVRLGGDVPAVVTRRVPVEEGVRCELDVPGGQLAVLAPNPGPAVGERITVGLTGGLAYGVPTAADPATVTQLQTPWTA